VTNSDERDERTGGYEVGPYCRRVESFLTQVNGGHLVRVVGPGFDLVRRWAEQGVPPNIVMRGIERKAERHRHGQSTRPLRIEFCESDVREVYDEWRRAIGVPSASASPGSPAPPQRKPSLPRHVERVLERIGRLTGRLDWPDELREGLEACREKLLAIQESAAGARGEARDAVVGQLRQLDRELLDLARRWAPADVRRAVEREAEADLAPYRDRLSDQLWRQSVEVTAARLLRDRLSLPTVELPG
jgi:hypothetical protein